MSVAPKTSNKEFFIPSRKKLRNLPNCNNHQLKSGTKIPIQPVSPCVHPHQTPQLRFRPSILRPSQKKRNKNIKMTSQTITFPSASLTIKLPYQYRIPSKKGYGTCSICSSEFEFYFIIINFNVERIKVESTEKRSNKFFDPAPSSLLYLFVMAHLLIS